MARLVSVLALAAIVLGITALAVQTERSSAGDIGNIRNRLDIQCTRTVIPSEDNGWKGTVECSVTIDIPPRLEERFGWPDTVKVSIVATYEDVNQNGRPNRGDRLQCAVVDGPAGFHLERPPGCAG